MKWIAATVALGLMVVSPAVASGPIKAPSPAAPDGFSFFSYLGAFERQQMKDMTRTEREVDRWFAAPVDSKRERRVVRNHRRAVTKVRANARAMARDLAGLNGCQADLVRSQSILARAHVARSNALGSTNLAKLVLVERSIGFQWGRFDGLAVQTAVCLAEQGWQFQASA